MTTTAAVDLDAITKRALAATSRYYSAALSLARESDGTWIASAEVDVPLLVAEVEKLRAALAATNQPKTDHTAQCRELNHADLICAGECMCPNNCAQVVLRVTEVLTAWPRTLSPYKDSEGMSHHHHVVPAADVWVALGMDAPYFPGKPYVATPSGGSQ